MMEPVTAFILAVFVLAGFAKGVIGLGLPTISMGLLAVVLAPAEAAAILILPSLLTNVWQMLAGAHLRSLTRRLMPLLLGVVAGTWAGSGLLNGTPSRTGAIVLGAALIAYAVIGLAAVRFAVPRSSQRWLGPLVGAITGLITAATGVFVIPAVPYLQAIGFERDELVQALGLCFTVSTLALAANLAHVVAPTMSLAALTLGATAMAFVGMEMGQRLRGRLDPVQFRFCFFAGLLALGAYVALRAAM
jgi:uncharacterized membrane protein YfcA